MLLKDRYSFVLQYFEKTTPNPETELHYTNDYELLVAVILSAQCTDVRINQTTPKLFAAYPNVYSLAKASEQDIFTLIRSVTYPNNKAKHLKNMALMICDKFNGNIPSDETLLQKLPGVGRKTANVVASVLHTKPLMAVDTHVYRVSARLGLTHNAKSPLQTEMQLVKNIPEALIHKAHHWLILHGRYTCKARNPECTVCGVSTVCKYYKKTQPKKSSQ